MTEGDEKTLKVLEIFKVFIPHPIIVHPIILPGMAWTTPRTRASRLPGEQAPGGDVTQDHLEREGSPAGKGQDH